MSNVSLTIPEEDKQKLTEIADTLNVSVSALLRDWIDQVLKSMEREKESRQP
jgi:predicted transcriptional regulator